MQRTVFTIIGGGFSGSMLAVQLAHLPGGPYATDVHLVEPRPALGPGLAYSTPDAAHLLNVRTPSLSAFPDQPDHFTEWLQRRGASACAQGFCSRQLYGQYLQELVHEVLKAPAANGLRFFWHATTAVAAPALPSGELAVALASGETLVSQRVVLALGNFPPPPPADATATYWQHPGFHANPWAPGALQGIKPTDDILLIGSGLTAVDVLLSLQNQGHQGLVTAVSGHGRWPAPHSTPQPAYPSFFAERLQAKATVGEVLRAVRAEVAAAAARGHDWRPVLDSLRPHLGAIWQAWPLAEQSRFLRHLASLWTTLRHRSPPQNAIAIDRWLSSGQLRQHVGRVQHLQPQGPNLEVTVRHAGQSATLLARHVISCTGPLLDYSRINAPLVAQLRAAGQLLPDALRLGLQTDAHGALRQADGQYSTQLYTLGASRRPQSFESTAVPELRQQATDLAHHLRESLQPQPVAAAASPL